MKPLLDIKKPDYVNFCPIPLSQASETEIQSLSIEEINKKFSKHRGTTFQWSPNIFVPESWELTPNDHALLNQCYEKMIPANSFVICYINDEVGYGVFNRASIRKGNILFYAGVWTPRSDQPLKYSTASVDKSYTFDAEKQGDYSGVFQDLYHPEINLENPFLTMKVARFNFRIERLTLSCGEISYFRAITDIKPFSHCGISYSLRYWQAMHLTFGTRKQYFCTKGTTIPDALADFLQTKELTPVQVSAFLNRQCEQGQVLGGFKFSPGAKNIDEHIPSDSARFFSILKVMLQSQQPAAPKQKASAQEPSFRFMQGVFNNKPGILEKYQGKDKMLPNPELALRRAASQGNFEDLRTLLKDFKSLNINEASSNGKTALDWAETKGHTKIVELLKQYGAKKGKIASKPSDILQVTSP